MKARKYRKRRSLKNIVDFKVGNEEYPEYLRLWILRILCELGGHRKFLHRSGFSCDTLALFIGLDEWNDTAKSASDEVELNRKKLRHLYSAEIDNLAPIPCHDVLAHNVENIAKTVSLNEADCRILEFVILLQTEQILVSAVECLGDMSLARTYHALSTILDLPLQVIKNSLKKNAILARTGLVSIRSLGAGLGSLDLKLDIISSSFADLTVSDIMDPAALLQGRLIPAKAPNLALENYQHLDKHLRVVLPYLRHVKKSRRSGVNILIYGQPGTGKSQLVKVLAKKLNSELFEVATEDEDGDILQGNNRLDVYRAALAFLANRDVFIVFEEIEDIFPDTPTLNIVTSFQPNNGMNKALINHMLEENTVPTFWVSNSIRSLDPAFTRRFDFVIEMSVPPREIREQIIKTACDGIVSKKFVTRLAESDIVAPAVITRIASVARSIKNEIPAQAITDSIEMMVESTLKAQGLPIKISSMSTLPDHYNLDYINTTINLNKLVSGLENNKSCRICLYGPPGTGKTAFGHWLAKKLDMPIIVKRVSDLQSPYLGEAEMNIAAAFKQAMLDNSILLIDEVDSFLQDRRSADKSWEVSQVNEFLTQMESFSGVFIASTNLMNGLDQAAMRRFDIKAYFGYLKPDQAWQLFREQCKLQSISIRKKGLRKKLAQLSALTPGDFAVIVRSSRFDPIEDAWHMVERLEEECSLKDTGRTSIGFL